MARITSGTFAGPAGRLEYILNETEAGPTVRAGLVCHPHPLYGGSMHTKVVFQTAQALAQRGMAVLRFHFRGVGRSSGTYDHGQGEQADLLAALAYLREQYPLPVVLAGFSFGATMVAKVLAAEAREEVQQAVLLGLPADRGEIPAQWVWQGPKIMISGAQDEFARVESLERYFALLAEPKSRQWVAGGDHFMTGQTDAYREALQRQLDWAEAALAG